MIDSYHTLRLTTCEEVFRHLLLVTKRRESIDLQLHDRISNSTQRLVDASNSATLDLRSPSSLRKEFCSFDHRSKLQDVCRQ